MTPLIHAILKESTKPIRERQNFSDSAQVYSKLPFVHCFEVTEALPLAHEMRTRIVTTGSSRRLGFLPAPLTVLEWKPTNLVSREAILLEEKGDDFLISNIHWYWKDGFFTIGKRPMHSFVLPLDHGGRAVGNGLRERREYLAQLDNDSNECILALLAIINTPRVIGRRQHMPHRGLERDLARQRGMVGRFPLQAWTEIKLEIMPQPRDASAEPSHEAHYTGQRALHFCRRHLRIRGGQIELVRPHWRGDPSLGIKQSRYVLQNR